MDKELYEMIFKRKSFHLFRNIGKVLLDELRNINKKIIVISSNISEVIEKKDV